MVVEEVIINQVKINMGCQKGDKILVLSDVFDNNICPDGINRLSFAQFYYKVLKNHGYSTEFFAYPNTGKSGSEPIAKVSRMMLGYDIILLLNYYSLSHTNARRNASNNGARIASMPGFTPSMYDDIMAADYTHIKNLTHKVTKVLNNSLFARITSRNGTNLELELQCAESDTGIYTKAGDWGNLPAGESCLAPKNAKGVYVVPKNWRKGLDSDLTLLIEDNLLKEVIGKGVFVKRFKKDVIEVNGFDYVAELGVGTNNSANRKFNILEIEKKLGTCHIAFGDNTSFPGGRNECDLHADFIIPEPNILLDDSKYLLKNGNLFSNI